MPPKPLIAPSPTSQPIAYPLGKITKKRNEAKRDKTKIGVGNLVMVKVVDIDEKIREGGSRMMRKDQAYALQLP